jgi:hypothetical protein
MTWFTHAELLAWKKACDQACTEYNMTTQEVFDSDPIVDQDDELNKAKKVAEDIFIDALKRTKENTGWELRWKKVGHE